MDTETLRNAKEDQADMIADLGTDQPPYHMMQLDRPTLKDLYLINHMPRRALKPDGMAPTKQQAHEVRAGMANCPGI